MQLMNALFIVGGAFIALLVAGYWAQGSLPAPPIKVVGIDLGTTYSCIGAYQSVSGAVIIFEDEDHHKCIPSVVSFHEDRVDVGYAALAQQEHNAHNTIYDAKRFIGKKFTQQELDAESKRYQFKMVLDGNNMVKFKIALKEHEAYVSPEAIGGHIIRTLRKSAEKNMSIPGRAVISVPAEFDDLQRNATSESAALAGFDILRVINEPTAAALAYGLHKKKGVHSVMVVDLGGGTLDVSLLAIQGGMFLTQAMAGNNHLGGQDFNNHVQKYLSSLIEQEFAESLTDADDLQSLRTAVEKAKIQLTTNTSCIIDLEFSSFNAAHGRKVHYKKNFTREEFEKVNEKLFQKVLEPIRAVLKFTEMHKNEVNEVVLVGGSTRIPKIRQIIANFFNKSPNVAIDADLAVVSGVSIQAGIIGGMWPLTVSAIEVSNSVRKIHL